MLLEKHYLESEQIACAFEFPTIVVGNKLGYGILSLCLNQRNVSI